jgi:hypothetical protein
MATALPFEAWVGIMFIIGLFALAALGMLAAELDHETRLVRLQSETHVLRRRQMERLQAMRGEPGASPESGRGLMGDFELIEDSAQAA